MVSSSLLNSLSPCAHYFKRIVTVGEIKRYKPAPEVYEMLAQKVGKEKEEVRKIWLVSENPVDVVGARAVGMQAVWVDRAESSFGWADRLVEGEEGRPTAVVRGLSEIAEIVKRYKHT